MLFKIYCDLIYSKPIPGYQSQLGGPGNIIKFHTAPFRPQAFNFILFSHGLRIIVPRGIAARTMDGDVDGCREGNWGHWPQKWRIK